MTAMDTNYARFEALEERLAHCYFILHERFNSDPQLATFWAEAAMDELQHSSLLKFCRERGIMTAAEIDSATSERLRRMVDTVSSIVSNPEVTVEQAFYASLLIESSEVDDVFAKLTQPLNKDHILLHQAIDASLRLHHLKFAEAAGKFLKDQACADSFRRLGESKS